MTFQSLIDAPRQADRSVCVIGMGYVGLTLAVVLADNGSAVFGVEQQPAVAACLARGVPHFHEPGLGDRLRRLVRQDRLKVGEQIPTGLDADVFIITVGTPLDGAGVVRTDMIGRAARQLAGHLRPRSLVVLRSTVSVGVTRSIVAPILDQAGVPYDLAFCPERTVEGQALSELPLLPQIVGADDEEAGLRAARFFSRITPTVIRVSSLEAAETIKLIDNSYRDLRFAFANQIALFCEQAGLNALEIIRAATLSYPRTDVPRPGPVGGPCLEKDPHIFAQSMAKAGIEGSLMAAARGINERQPAESVARIKAVAASIADFPAAPKIRVLGLAFKGRPATDDIRGTMARPILRALRQAFPGGSFGGYDAMIAPEEIERQFDITGFDSLQAAFDHANLIVIANNYATFETMDIEGLSASMAPPGIIYDYWNSIGEPKLLGKGITYIGLGTSDTGFVGREKMLAGAG